MLIEHRATWLHGGSIASGLTALAIGCSAPPRAEETWQRLSPAPARIDCESHESADYPVSLPTFDLYVNPSDWDSLHVDVYADVEVDATVCFEGQRYAIELELHGASSRKRAKKSFDFKWNRGRKLPATVYRDGEGGEPIDKLVVKAMASDQSLIREAVAFDLIRSLGIDAPRNGFANLRINGDYWGLYALVEPIDEGFLAQRGYPAEGTLYKGIRTKKGTADFAEGRKLKEVFESKDDTDYEDLERLVAAMQDTPLELAAFESAIDPIFPLDEYIDRMAWVAFTQNSDAGGQNFYLYNAKAGDLDQWVQLPWDSDVCCGAHWQSPDRVAAVDDWLMLDGGNHFARRMLRVPELNERFQARFRALLDDTLTTERASQFARTHAEHIAHDLALDQKRWERSLSPEAALDTVLEFFAERPAVLQRELGIAGTTDMEHVGGSEGEED